MKCKCCDVVLTETEIGYRDAFTGVPLDTCEDCLEAQGSSLVDDEVIDSLFDIGIDL
jgi:hypothetical protein